MSAGKRGGARPGAGRKPTFTIEQEWTIGAMVVERMKNSMLEPVNEKIFEDTPYMKAVGELHAVPDEYKSDDPHEQAKLAGEYRQSQPAAQEISKRLKTVSYWQTYVCQVNLAAHKKTGKTTKPVKISAKPAAGIREKAIHDVGRFLRGKGIKVSDHTVRHCLNRYRVLQKRLSREKLFALAVSKLDVEDV